MDEELYGGWSRERFTGTDISEIEMLIADNPTESHNLEYKAAGWLSEPDWKQDLAWHVAALANSAGGLMLIGVRETPPPAIIDPLSVALDLARIRDILTPGVERALDYRHFDLVRYDLSEGQVHALFVPQSMRAPHMVVSGGVRGKYYGRYPKRAAAGTQPMLDYEVRDMMFRRQRPDLRLHLVQVQTPQAIMGTVRSVVYLGLQNHGQATARDTVIAVTQQKEPGVDLAPNSPLWSGRRCRPGLICVSQRLDDPVLPRIDAEISIAWAFGQVQSDPVHGFRSIVEAAIYADGAETVRQYFRWHLPSDHLACPEGCCFAELLGDAAGEAARVLQCG